MPGDVGDVVARIRAALPKRWFGETSPNLDAILTGLATPWSWLYGMVGYVSSQSRLATATDRWLDLLAVDFLGPYFRRQPGESDQSFRTRISMARMRARATRPAMISGLSALCGTPPAIFEPSRCADTGAYAAHTLSRPVQSFGLAYGRTGGWGSLNLPWQIFITVARPPVPGLANLSGYGVPAAGYGHGSIAYVDLAALPGRIDDTDIQRTVRDLLPVNATAWLRIT